jgi:hypothetical protein
LVGETNESAKRRKDWQYVEGSGKWRKPFECTFQILIFLNNSSAYGGIPLTDSVDINSNLNREKIF